MFERITPRYDLMNRLMTFGRDGAWRRATIAAVAPTPGSRALDVGCGTGDLTGELTRARVRLAVGLDPVPAMLTVAAAKLDRLGEPPTLVLGDGLALPFPDGAFECVVSAFVLRNVADLPGALREARRVLKPGGRIGVLELTPVRIPLIGWAIRLYFHRLVPWMGGLIAGDPAAYAYLPASVDRFPTADQLAGLLDATGFRRVRYRRFMFATVALHVAER